MASSKRPHRVIFVCGSARSGSTLVDLVLGNDPRGFSLGEVASWFRPTRTHHFDIKCGCGVYPCPVWSELARVPERDLYPALFAKLDLDFAVDSSKRLPWVIDQNLRLRRMPDFEVRNLFLYKDPVALAHSYFKRGQDVVSNVKRSYSYYDEALRARLPMVTLEYDALVADPAGVLPQLCDWLQLECREGKMEFWRHTSHHLFGSTGPRRQLHEGRGSIYVERFTPEFEEQREAIGRSLSADASLMRILDRLRALDLRHATLPPSLEGAVSIRRPRFYWEQKARDWKARFWPQHHLDKEASLIREWRV